MCTDWLSIKRAGDSHTEFYFLDPRKRRLRLYKKMHLQLVPIPVSWREDRCRRSRYRQEKFAWAREDSRQYVFRDRSAPYLRIQPFVSLAGEAVSLFPREHRAVC